MDVTRNMRLNGNAPYLMKRADPSSNFFFSFFSPGLQTMNLPILTCSYCRRKVGLWNFYQMEGTGDGDVSAPASGPVSSATPEVQDDQAASASSAPSATPLRMKLRSQDTIHPDQAGIDHKKLDHM